MSKLYYCMNCDEYTMSEICGRCRGKTVSRNPPRFSPQDPYGEYRRKLKKILDKKGE